MGTPINMSIEMYVVKLDELLEVRSQYSEQLEELGLFDVLEETKSITFHDNKQFIDTAIHLGIAPQYEEVNPAFTTVRGYFEYKGVEFQTFLIGGKK